MENQQGIFKAPILIIVATVVVAGVAGYFLFKAGGSNQTESSTANANQVANNNASSNSNTTINTNTVSNTNTATDLTAGWKTFTNIAYGFSFRYPNDMTIDTSKTSTSTAPRIRVVRDPNNYDDLEYYDLLITTLVNPGEINIKSNPECYSRKSVKDFNGNVWTMYDEKCGLSSQLGLVSYILLSNTHSFDFSYPDTAKTDVIEKILSTFEFTH